MCSGLQFLKAVIIPHSKGSWGPFRRKPQPTAQSSTAGLPASLPPSRSIFPLPTLIGIQFHQRLQAPGSGFNQELELSPRAVAWQSSVRPRWRPTTFSSPEVSWRRVLDFWSLHLWWWPCGCTFQGPFFGEYLQRLGEGRQTEDARIRQQSFVTEVQGSCSAVTDLGSHS